MPLLRALRHVEYHGRARGSEPGRRRGSTTTTRPHTRSRTAAGTAYMDASAVHALNHGHIPPRASQPTSGPSASGAPCRKLEPTNGHHTASASPFAQ